MTFKSILKKVAFSTLSLVLLLALVSSVFAPTSAATGPTKENPTIDQPQTSDTGKHTITLITGDVVTLTDIDNGKSTVSVEPAAHNNEGTRMITINEDTYVLPRTAMPYLAAGILDKELFNITYLKENGYDDVKRSTTPIIVQYTLKNKTNSQTIASMPQPAATKRTHVLESIQGAALSTEKKQAEKFWKDMTHDSAGAKIKPTKNNSKTQFNNGIQKIWLDGRVKASLDESVPQIGAPEAWDAGYNGKDTKVAVLDTGIDKEHPDIEGQLKEAVSFVPDEDVLDRHGHGTHVASTVLGSGSASDGRYQGVAPGASLLVGKVLADDGFGQESWVIEGMEWAAHNAKVVNMSLSDGVPSDGTDPMSQAVNRLSEETGALFVIAAGNEGMEGGIGSPSAADSALTVGAVDKSDQLTWFSNMGPRTGDAALKPDLVAPGEAITAARSQYSGGDGHYTTMNGTSMATPHVAGAAAILAQKHPSWTNSQLKNALMSSTKQLDSYQPYQVGTGRLDVATAVSTNIRATGSLSFGFFKWPHDNDKPVEKTVTYHNDSNKDISLDLTSTFTDENGDPAPEGMLTLPDHTVTVPANGSADVTVTLDPKFGEAGSRYQGQLVAAADGKTTAHTAMVMIKEDEQYNLTMNAIDRDGSPGIAHLVIISEDLQINFVTVDGTNEMRLPKGTYSVMSLMDVDVDTDHHGLALVGDPEVELNADKTVNLDARKAHEVKAEVPKKTAPSFQRLEYYRQMGQHTVVDAFGPPVYSDKMYAVPTKTVEQGQFEMAARWRLTEPVITVNFNGKELDATPLPGMTPLNGNYHLDTVYAGKGTPDDYQQITAKGKAVVVDRNDDITGAKQADAALQAGAKLLIIANDGPEKLWEFVGKDYDTDTPLAVASISGTEGDELISSIQNTDVTLEGKGTPDTPYLYDLVQNHKAAIPEDLTYAPDPDELVKINARYTSDHPAPGAEFRYDSRHYSVPSLGASQRISLPAVRTEWVSATEGTEWRQNAYVLDADNPTTTYGSWGVRGASVTYEPGERLNEEWFAPVIRPRFGEGYWPPFRSNDYLQTNIPSHADSQPGHTGSLDNWGITQQLQEQKLYQGDTLVAEGSGQAMQNIPKLPKERLKYRLVSDTKRDKNLWEHSTQTHTEWTFWSEDAEGRVELPMLSLDYKMDTNIAGHVLSGRSNNLTLNVAQLDGVKGYGDIEDVTLEISYDEGKNWNSIKPVQNENGWVVEFNPPKTSDYVSLRASAKDDEGNAIIQEVMEAYELTASGASDMQQWVKQFEKQGDFADDTVARALNLQLITVGLYEKNGNQEKVVKHLQGLQALLDHQKKEELISGRAYNVLDSDVDYLMKMWQ